MDGIIILNTITTDVNVANTFMVVFTTLIFIVIGFAVWGMTNVEDWFPVLMGILGLAIGIVIITCIPIEPETKYEVYLTDEVRMEEFSQKYIIIEQKDKIYVIKERMDAVGQD